MSSRKERGGVMLEGATPSQYHSQGGDGAVVRGKTLNIKESRSKYDKKPSLPPCGAQLSTPGKKGHRRGHNTYARGHSDQRHPSQSKRELDYEDIVYLEKEFTGSHGRKSNPTALNHLLNFTLTPRESHSGDYYSTAPSWRRTKKTQCYNKENFLQANCQFVVRAGKDYGVHSTEPDLLVEWDNVEQVRLLCHEMSSCPICLHPPTAAKITRCGHVYCSSCVLHYLTLTDKKWRKCPICYESIYKKDLKSVMALASSRYSNGDIITMTLMMRHKHSTIVQPRSQWTGEHGELPSLDSGRCGHFAKLIQATPSQIKSEIIEKEKELLLKQLETITVHEESERCFVEAAIADLREREEELATSSVGGPPCGVVDNKFDQPDGNKENVSEDKVVGDGNASGNDDSTSSNGDSSPGPATDDYIYFYQACDGQHLYIHSLNAKCLLKEYACWSKCPDTITASVLEMEQFSMTEEVRGHYRYLSHLPLTCQFMLCELHLVPPLLSQDTLDEFSDQLSKRRQQRQRKKREERRRERKYERNDTGPLAVPSNTTPEGFHDFLSMASSPPLYSPLSAHIKPEGVANTSPKEECRSEESTTPSFAQALAKGERKTPVKMIKYSPTSPVSVPGNSSEEEQNVPSFQSSFSEALVAASQSVKAATLNHGGKPGGSKAAKKGRKKMVLFSTGGTRQL